MPNKLPSHNLSINFQIIKYKYHESHVGSILEINLSRTEKKTFKYIM